MPKKASEFLNSQENFVGDCQLFHLDCRDSLQRLGDNSIIVLLPTRLILL